MKKHSSNNDTVLSDKVIEDLVEAVELDPLPDERRKPLLKRVMESICLAVTPSLADYHTVHLDAGLWSEVSKDVEMKILYKDDRGTSFMLRLQPGASLSSHTHAADEECLVLEGELTLGEGIHLQAGDYHFAAKGLPHATAFSEQGALIFLRSEVPAYQP